MQYTNFKYANSFGNRCAIFARPTGVGEKRTEVFILECSKRDPFSRRKAREVYQNYIETGQPLYSKTRMEYIREEIGVMVTRMDEPDVICHPQIFELPLPFNNKHITRFCETFLKRWLSRQELKNYIKLLETDYQIEK